MRQNERQERPRSPQEVPRKPWGGVKNDSKTLPKSSQKPPKMAPGSPAEKRPTRALKEPRGAKTTQSERQERPKSVSRAIFSKIRPQRKPGLRQLARPNPLFTLANWESDRPASAQKKATFSFCRSKGRVRPRAPSESPHDAPQTTSTNFQLLRAFRYLGQHGNGKRGQKKGATASDLA